MSSATKYEGGHPRGRSVTLDRHPRVEAYDCQGTDELDNGVPIRIVTLVPGYAFEDAAENEGDDPESIMALHSKGFSSVADALDRIRNADPCKCGRCLAQAARRR